MMGETSPWAVFSFRDLRDLKRLITKENWSSRIEYFSCFCVTDLPTYLMCCEFIFFGFSFSDQSVCRSPCYFFFTSLPKFSSSCALVVVIPSLHVWAAFLYCLQDVCLCFHCLWVSFLFFSSARRGLHNHIALLLSLPYFLHLRIKSSWAW